MLSFYLALGFVMYTAILGIFEMSLSISNQRFINKPKLSDPNEIIRQKNNDKIFLNLLESIQEFNLSYDNDDENIKKQNDICLDIHYGFDYEDGIYSSILRRSEYNIINSYNPGVNSYSTHSRFINSCSLVSDSHRVVIYGDNYNTDEYSYYSCILDMDPICRFELVD